MYKKRPDYDCAIIGLLTVSGVEYGNLGYANDLYYCQGEESLYKAGRLAKNMPEEKGQELIAFIKKSNNEMEMSCRA